MNCSDNTNITITNIKFAPQSGKTFLQKNALNGSIQSLNITLIKPTSLAAIFNTTHWQIMPDSGLSNRQCTGFIIFSAEAS